MIHMVSALERNIWRVETRISHTLELGKQSNSVGVGIIVMNAETGDILLGEEPNDKFVNGYLSVKKGDISIPIESRKEDREFDYQTIQAGLIEEVLGGTDIDAVQNRLFFLSRTLVPQFFPEAIKVNGSEKRGSLVVVMYDPQNNDVLKNPSGDLLNLRWSTLTDALEIDNLRTHARDFLHVFCHGRNPSGVAHMYQDNYWKHREKRFPIFLAKFNKQTFLEERNAKQDIYRSR